MARRAVSKRLVFHVGGYDPITPYAGAQRRFIREIARFQTTWSVKATIDGLHDGADQTKWSVATTGPNWQVETDYRLVRWDDVIETLSRRTMFWRIPLGIVAFWILSCLALSGLLTNQLALRWILSLSLSHVGSPRCGLGSYRRACRKGQRINSCRRPRKRLVARSASGWPLALVASGCTFRRLIFSRGTFERLTRSSSKD